MSHSQIPLTPAAQMKQIREAVYKSKESNQDTHSVLADYFSRLETLRDRVTDLESKMLLKEQPFVSHAPVIGPLIIRVRYLWNWMSTKWYLLPLIEQQNRYNMAVTQTMRETLTTMEGLLAQVQDLQVRHSQLQEKTLSNQPKSE